jgi:hypothetical protein
MSETQVAYGSNLQALYAVEDSWGVLASSPVIYKLRTTSFNVNLNRDSFTSNELRSDRQTSDHRQGMDDVSGDIGVELSNNAFDDLIASAMFNEWAIDGSIVIGTTQSSLRLQKAFPLVGQYHEFSGCVVNSWSLSVAPNAVITSTFSFMGKQMHTYTTEGGDTADAMSGAIDKGTGEPFDSFSGSIYEGGTSSGDEIAIVTGIDLSVENNITPMQVIGNRNAIGLAEGRANVTGTLSAYFVDSTMLNKFINETESSIQFVLSDPSGNSYQFYLPRIKYSGSTLDVGDEGPVSVSMPFVGLIPSTSPNSTLEITKL